VDKININLTSRWFRNWCRTAFFPFTLRYSLRKIVT